MAATTATATASVSVSVIAAIQAASPRAADSDARNNDAGGTFDSHLDAARQQRDAAPAPASPAPAAPPPAASRGSAGAPDLPPSGTAVDKSSGDAAGAAVADATGDAGDKADDASDDTDTDGASALAGAMLALLGQALPNSASAVAGGAAKVLSASVLKSTAGKALTDDPGAGVQDGDAAALAAAAASQVAATPPAAVAAAAAIDAAATGAAHKDDDLASIKDLGAASMGLPQPGNTAVAADTPHALQVASPVGTPAFAQELGQQVAWLGGQDVKEARIRLHPEDMGQLDVKVSVQHDNQVDVTFAVQHPQAVHAVQQTLSQLDSMLAQHGLSLGQADVGQRQQGGHGSGGGSGEGASSPFDALDEIAATPAQQAGTPGLLDTFA